MIKPGPSSALRAPSPRKRGEGHFDPSPHPQSTLTVVVSPALTVIAMERITVFLSSP